MNPDNDKLQKGFDEITDKEVPPSFVWNNIANKLETEDSDALQTGFDKYYSDEEPPISVWNNIQNTLTNNPLQDNNNLDDSTTDNAPYSWKQRLQKIAMVILLLIFVRTCLPETCGPETARSAPSNIMYALHHTDISSNQNSSNHHQNTLQEDKILGTVRKSTSSIPSKTNLLQSTANKPLKAVANSNFTLISSNSKKHSTSSEQHNSKSTSIPLEPTIAISYNLNNTENLNNQSEQTSTSAYPFGKLNTLQQISISAYFGKLTSPGSVWHSTPYQQHISTPIIDSAILPLAETLAFDLEKKQKQESTKFPKFELGLVGKLGTSLLLGKMTNEGFRHSSLQETQIKSAGGIGLLVGLRITAKDAVVAQFSPYTSISQSFGAFSSEGKHYDQVVNLSYMDFSVGYERNLIVYDIVNDNNASLFARLDIGISYLTLEQFSVNEEIIQTQAFKKWSFFTGLALGNRHQFKHFVFDYGFYGSIGMNDINNNTYFQNQTTNLLQLGGFVAIKYKL